MDSPLLETTVEGATDIIINFSGDVGIQEVYEAVSCLTEEAGDEANIIFGNVDSEDVAEDEVSITIIATGIQDDTPRSSRPMMGGETAARSVRPAQTSAGGSATFTNRDTVANGRRYVDRSAAADNVEIKIPEFLQKREK